MAAAPFISIMDMLPVHFFKYIYPVAFQPLSQETQKLVQTLLRIRGLFLFFSDILPQIVRYMPHFPFTKAPHLLHI